MILVLLTILYFMIGAIYANIIVFVVKSNMSRKYMTEKNFKTLEDFNGLSKKKLLKIYIKFLVGWVAYTFIALREIAKSIKAVRVKKT